MFVKAAGPHKGCWDQTALTLKGKENIIDFANSLVYWSKIIRTTSKQVDAMWLILKIKVNGELNFFFFFNALQKDHFINDLLKMFWWRSQTGKIAAYCREVDEITCLSLVVCKHLCAYRHYALFSCLFCVLTYIIHICVYDYCICVIAHVLEMHFISDGKLQFLFLFNFSITAY